ncbi:MAG: hypothetical protein JST90_02795 [Bacteroidetes bacterium]|nr:hypothetical protein [Bacteroidota bacterium]
MRVFRTIFLVPFAILVALATGEAIVRLAGFKPYHEAEIKFDYRPKPPGGLDSIYGYSLAPGYYTIIKNDTFVYHATHNDRRRRITGYDTLNDDHFGKVIILGCSFTYGDCLEDSCTHPFILQNLFKEHNVPLKVENWGVGGYCPAQFFLQAKEIIRDTVGGGALRSDQLFAGRG